MKTGSCREANVYVRVERAQAVSGVFETRNGDLARFPERSVSALWNKRSN
jgi:hypothetical protein